MKLPTIVVLDSIEQINQLNSENKLTGLFNVSNELYHAGPGISSTSLKNILRSPAHYKYSENVTTPAMKFGTMIHESILEPDIFSSKYIVMPKFDRRTKAGKAEYAEFIEANKNKTPATQDELNEINSIKQSFINNKYCRNLLKTSTNELAAYTYDDDTGLLIKAKADILHHGSIYAIADIKSCDDARPSNVSKTISKYRYDLSAAFYMDIFSKVLGQDISSFIWAFVEKKKPYGIRTYLVNNEVYEHGKTLYKGALNLLNTCIENDSWQAYDEALEDIQLPAWDN